MNVPLASFRIRRHLALPALALMALVTTAAADDLIVRTTKGQLLRGQGRQSTDAPLTLKTAGGVVTIPASEILSVHQASELKGSLKKMRRAAGDDPAQLARVAHWATSQGLLREADKVLDEVLEQDPWNAQATALLRDQPLLEMFAVDLDDPAGGARKLLKLGARSLSEKAVTRKIELCLEKLGPDLYEGVLGSAILSKKSKERAFAIQALGRLMPKENLKQAIRMAVLDRSKDVRQAANEILTHSQDDNLVHTLRQALRSKHPPIRRNAAEALGALRDPRAVSDLIARVTYSGGTGQRVNISNVRQISYIQDFDVEVAQAAFIGDPVINIMQEGAVLDVTLLGTYGETDYYLERGAALRALRDITGERFSDVKSWQKYWNKNGDQIIREYERKKGIQNDQDVQRIR